MAAATTIQANPGYEVLYVCEDEKEIAFFRETVIAWKITEGDGNTPICFDWSEGDFKDYVVLEPTGQVLEACGSTWPSEEAWLNSRKSKYAEKHPVKTDDLI